MTSAVRGVLLLFSILSLAYGLSGKSPLTVVQVRAWTTSGERVERIWAVVSALDGRENYKGDGREVRLSVPTGEYMLQVEAPGFQTKRQILRAYQPEVFRSVALPVAWIHGQGASSLTGTIRNYDGDVRELRVRLIGLYGDELRESLVNADDSFSFPADAGAYLLMVVADLDKGVAVIDSRPIRISGKAAIIIDLTGKCGTPLPLASQ